jgi:uncharacterized protein YxjI
MARYLMRQKWFAFGDDFVVEDAHGHEAFFVDGAAFSWGKKLSVQAPRGHEVAFIAQKLLSWGPTYEILRGDEVLAIVRKQLFTFFRVRFSVDVPGPDDLEAEGDFLDHEYVMRRGDEVVARVSKRWFALTDTYGIDVTEGADDVLIVATAVVVDLCCHQPR